MKPARFYFCLGSFGAPCLVSSDALGMPWEIMGVYIYFGETTLMQAINRSSSNKIWAVFVGNSAHIDANWRQITTYSAEDAILKISHKFPK